MADLTVKEIEVVRNIPGNPPEKGGPAKVLRLIFDGDERQPEMFTTAKSKVPGVGESIPESDLEWNEQWNRWQIKKKDTGKGGGGFKRSPAETKAIQRQHSQEQALRKEANLIAAGGRPFGNEEMQIAINYFEDDIAGNAGHRGYIREDDVPFDDEGLEPLPFGSSE